jgi:Phage minor capsid protein 2
MAIAPEDWEFLAERMLELYQRVSDEIMTEIVKRIRKDIDAPDYLYRKYNDVQELQRRLHELIGKLERTAFDEVEKMVEQAYFSGVLSADEDIQSIIKSAPGLNIAIPPELLEASLTTVDRRAVVAIVAELHGKMRQSHLMILRSADDAFRRIIGEVSAEALAGAGTRLQAAQKALDMLATQGISGYVASNGARWELATYVEMATRSAIGQASIEGHIMRQRSYSQFDIDLDLVSVSNHPEECEKCRPWEGKILSLSGNSERYASLQEARDAGLFHPRCGHRLHTYVEGVTPKPLPAKPDPDGYKKRQYQRYLERQIRHWKKRQLVAVTPEAQKLANSKVKEWQGKMREWISDKDRYRRYERERITGAR